MIPFYTCEIYKFSLNNCKNDLTFIGSVMIYMSESRNQKILGKAKKSLPDKYHIRPFFFSKL